jgi:hypothetical protein
MAYGSLVRRQGRSRPFSAYQARSRACTPGTLAERRPRSHPVRARANAKCERTPVLGRLPRERRRTARGGHGRRRRAGSSRCASDRVRSQGGRRPPRRRLEQAGGRSGDRFARAGRAFRCHDHPDPTWRRGPRRRAGDAARARRPRARRLRARANARRLALPRRFLPCPRRDRRPVVWLRHRCRAGARRHRTATAGRGQLRARISRRATRRRTCARGDWPHRADGVAASVHGIADPAPVRHRDLPGRNRLACGRDLRRCRQASPCRRPALSRC